MSHLFSRGEFTFSFIFWTKCPSIHYTWSHLFESGRIRCILVILVSWGQSIADECSRLMSKSMCLASRRDFTHGFIHVSSSPFAMFFMRRPLFPLFFLIEPRIFSNECFQIKYQIQKTLKLEIFYKSQGPF